MADYGSRHTNKKISEVDRSLRKTYRTAQKELEKKLADFNRKSEARDRAKRKQVEEGKISKQDYKDWLAGQVFIRKNWENKIAQVSAVMTDHNRQAMKLINEGRLDTFAENYNYEAFQTEKVISQEAFSLYSAEAVAKLMLEDPQLLPEWKIDEPKDYKWNQQKVNNIVTQGIIQGESIDEITKRLCEDLCTQNENRMRMFARTAMTGAESAGRQEQMHAATKAGILVHKVWEATKDSRTRDWHRALDGQEVPENEPFESDLGEIEYPGDPSADPANVYNCRCTLKSIYPEYEDREAAQKRYEEMEIDGQSYQEWKDHKKETGQVVEQKASPFHEFSHEDVKNTKKSDSGTDELLGFGKKGKADGNGEKKKKEQKPFDIRSAKSITQIEKQMAKEGLIAKGSSANLKGIDIETAKKVYSIYKRMIESFPIMKGKLFGVEVTDQGIKENAYATCSSFVGGHIKLNSRYFKDIEVLRQCYAKDVKTGFHPSETTAEAILYHELGHGLDGILTGLMGGSKENSFSKMFLAHVCNEDEMYDRDSYSPDSAGWLISRYATKNEHEWFAECVGAMMNQKESNKSGMQRAFEKELIGYLSTLEGN